MTTMPLSELVSLLEKASYAYHNGLEETMTDAAYDTAVEELRARSPKHPFLTKVGAPLSTGDEVALPIVLPSLNKVKDSAALSKWTSKCCTKQSAPPSYHISAKLDGCSALWLPGSKKLYTRGDGLKGRDISAFVPHFQGFTTKADSKIRAVRGELIMRTDSTAIPAGKLARNIVAGALNRKAVDPALFAEIRFVAYELLDQETPVSPEESYRILRTAGYEVARATTLKALTDATLSELFTTAESKSPYQMDGIVLAPNVPRTTAPPTDGSNPTDRAAWKTRLTAATARTTVRAVEWNISHTGVLIPRVLFDTVTLAGANIGAATGLHGRWIYDNGVGPGAEIEVRRAGDVIPQIIAVHTKVSPAMPAAFQWETEEPGAIHIKPAGDEVATESACIKLTHSLGVLGVENVGPGIVAKLYEAGLTTIGKIYAASPATLGSGTAGKQAERTWAGLRASQAKWTTATLLCASGALPRGVSHAKVAPLLALNPNPATWSSAALQAARPAGLSDKTIEAIVASIPAYLAWLAETGFASPAPAPGSAPVKPAPADRMVVVMTGFRDKALETALTEAGHIVNPSVTKQTTHVLYPDGPEPASTKLDKAKSMGIPILPKSQLKFSSMP
jgi:DNA ligase (NAD+)